MTYVKNLMDLLERWLLLAHTKLIAPSGIIIYLYYFNITYPEMEEASSGGQRTRFNVNKKSLTVEVNRHNFSDLNI